MGGRDVVSLLLSYDLEFPVQQFPSVPVLDLSKAFGSCGSSLCLRILAHVGAPSQIVDPVTYKGPTAGDPWSPSGMSLVLTLAKHRADRLVPEVHVVLPA